MSTISDIRKPRSKRFYKWVIGGVLLVSCLCVGMVMSIGDDDPEAAPTATKTSAPSDTARPVATITNTARPSWTPKPTATFKPTSEPTVLLRMATIAIATNTPFIFRTLPPATAGCNCAVDYNCADFSRQSQAQACYNSCGGNNWSGLDSDGDGRACESLP